MAFDIEHAHPQEEDDPRWGRMDKATTWAAHTDTAGPEVIVHANAVDHTLYVINKGKVVCILTEVKEVNYEFEDETEKH